MQKFALCCIHNGLASKGHKFRTMTLKKFKTLPRPQALKELRDIYINNLYVTRLIMNECVAQGWAYRISSALFPLITEPTSNISFNEIPDNHRIIAEFDRIKQLIQTHNLSVCTHPDQFNVLASVNPNTVESTIRELNFHGWMLDMMGASNDYSAPINIHMNTYAKNGESLSDVAARFRKNFVCLSPSVQNRLVLENEDKPNSWSVSELINHHAILQVPITFDNLHHSLNHKGMSESDAFNACYSTWGTFTPRFHFSGSDNPQNPRAHADMPANHSNNYNLPVIWDVEFKAKELAVKYLAS